jgi:hypothetical protein
VRQRSCVEAACRRVIYSDVVKVGDVKRTVIKPTERLLGSVAAPNTKLLPPFNPLTPELNPSVQRCLTRFFTGDFAS